jgi:hypothetical protein
MMAAGVASQTNDTENGYLKISPEPRHSEAHIHPKIGSKLLKNADQDVNHWRDRECAVLRRWLLWLPGMSSNSSVGVGETSDFLSRRGSFVTPVAVERVLKELWDMVRSSLYESLALKKNCF